MNPTDLIPIKFLGEILQLSEEYKYLLLFFVLICGYVLFKIFNASHNLKDKFTGIDEIYLIVIFGLIFLFQMLFIGLISFFIFSSFKLFLDYIFLMGNLEGIIYFFMGFSFLSFLIISLILNPKSFDMNRQSNNYVGE